MLDLKAIREDPEPYRKALARRDAAADLDRALALDEERRRLMAEVERLRGEQNQYSKEIGRQSSADDRQAMIKAASAVSTELEGLEPDLARIDEELREVAARLPNIPDESTPDGETEEDNVEIRRWGEPPRFDFQPRDHVALGEALGLLDIAKGVRTSGSRFAYLMGAAARIQFALVRHAIDFTGPLGFTPVIPPVLVREEAMYGTGFLPTEEVNLYVTRDDDLYLTGTSEVALAALHAGEILEPEGLPRRYLGYSTCFRREAGTYGKDTAGIFRVHQFDKLERFSFVVPDIEESRAEHDRLLGWEEEWVRSLEVPYRVVSVCVGDLGPAASKKYDIEAWLPTQGKYRELTSTSNTTDYQARRMECRVRMAGGNRPAHTLNATLCAIGRTLIALLENGQQPDGSVVMPQVLQGYLSEEDWILKPRE
jgi:seryl-tRNA synthetase